jgi:hypothetical protein
MSQPQTTQGGDEMKLYGADDLHSSNNVAVVINEQDQVIYHNRLPNDLSKIVEVYRGLPNWPPVWVGSSRGAYAKITGEVGILTGMNLVLTRDRVKERQEGDTRLKV